MNLRQIEVFRAVMLTGSITGAAQLLHISQPAVSRLIAYTESRLGFKLFQRIKGRLSATTEAHKLYAEVETLYQGIQRVGTLARDLADQTGGVLRLVCSPTLAYSLLPLAMAQFAATHPNVLLRLDAVLVNPLMDALLAQRADLAIAIVPLQHQQIHVHSVFRSRVVVVLPPGHALADRRTIRVQDLAQQRLIGFAAETPLAHAIDRLFTGARTERRFVAEVKLSHVACAMVQAGLGVAIVDELVLLTEAWPQLVVRPLEPSVDLQVRVGYLRHEPLSRHAESFVECLQGLQHPFLAPTRPEHL